MVAMTKAKRGGIGDVEAIVISSVVTAKMTFNRVSICQSFFVWAIVSIVEWIIGLSFSLFCQCTALLYIR